MAPNPTAKAERLLNLVIALLNTRQYRSAAWIRRNVAGYGDAPSADAFSRMFERDKTELRELTVPLDTDGNDGYRIPPNEFSLPELTFTPEETAAVGLAARLWSTTSLASAGAQGLRKLREAGSAPAGRTADASSADASSADASSADASSADASSAAAHPADLAQVEFARADTVLQPRVRTSDPAFGPLQVATVARRQVRFDYRKRPGDAPVRRRLQPWGLVSFGGRWYVIGYDLDRQEQRTFRLSRIAGTVSATGKAGAYSVPTDVDLLEQVRQSATPVVERMAQVRVRPGRAVGLRRDAELISAATATAGTDPGAAPVPASAFAGDAAFDVLRIPMTGLWDTARRVVANGPDVQVVDPPDLRDAVVRLLRGTMEATR